MKYIIRCKLDRFMKDNNAQYLTAGKYYLSSKESYTPQRDDMYMFTDDRGEIHYIAVDCNTEGGLYPDEIDLISDLAVEEVDLINMLQPELKIESKQ